MVGVLRKGRYFLKSMIVCYQSSLPVSGRGKVFVSFQKWGKLSTRILTFGAGSAALAGVILSQTAPDDAPHEGAGEHGDVTNINKPPRAGCEWPDSGKDRIKTEKKNINSAIVESRDLIQRIKDETGCPGVVIGVSVDGETVWSEGLGFSDLENRTPIHPNTVLRIASISKSITMTIVAKLWEEGKLDLDAPVQKYVPDFPEKTVNGEKVTITTRQLVSHLSGIRHYEKNPKKTESDGKQDGKDKKSKETENDLENSNKEGDEKYKEFYLKKKFSSIKEALELFKDDPLLHKPGSEYLYTTHGWTLVSAVLEGASGQTFPKLLASLFQVVGMSNTYLDKNQPLIYHRGRHYVKSKTGRIVNAPYVDNSYKWAGGGLLSTVGDLLKFGNVMLYSFQREDGAIQVPGEHKSENKGKDTRSDSTKSNQLPVMDGVSTELILPGYLKQETVRKMWTVVDNTSRGLDKSGGYGMGWSVVPESYKHGFCQHQRYYVSHTGGAMGGSSVLLVYPCAKVRQVQGQGQLQDSRENVSTADAHFEGHTDQGRCRNQGEGHTSSQVDCEGQQSLPQGITVAIIANTSEVGLKKTAFQIAQIFEQADKE